MGDLLGAAFIAFIVCAIGAALFTSLDDEDWFA